MFDELRKSVDEEWKKKVEDEKEINKAQSDSKKEEESGQREFDYGNVTFSSFVASIATQTLISLGAMVNPITKKKTIDLDHARYTIETLKMLKEKTKGNLSADEKDQLDGVLFELHTAFVEVSNNVK